MVIRTASEAHEILRNEKLVSIDVETDGRSPWYDNILVVSVCGAESRKPAVLHLLDTTQDVAGMLVDLTANATRTWLTHNGTTFDLPMFWWRGFCFPRHYDTLVGEQVLSTQGRKDIRKDLGSTMKRRIGKSHKMKIDHTSWVALNLTEDQVEYAANDVLWLHEIKEAQERVASERGLAEALAKEQALTTIITQISTTGMYLDRPTLATAREKLIANAADARKRLEAEFGDGFNPRSAPQVKEALHSLGYPVKSTGKEILKLLKNCPQATDIITVREQLQRTGFYDDDWEALYVHTRDSRVRPRYWQVGTDTTRFSCSEPNMQQIPRDMRHIFGNEPGKKVVQGDWAQIEVRIAAHYSKDPDLVYETVEGDLHKEIAQLTFHYDEVYADTKGTSKERHEETMEKIFGVEVDHAQRRDGKAGTFTWLFNGREGGMKGAAAERGIQLSDQTAKVVLKYLDDKFPTMASFHSRARSLVYQKRVMIPIYLPWGHHRQLLRNARDRYGRSMQSPARLVNTLIQGTAAIGFKEALFDIERRGLLPYVGGLVHDEVVATSVPDAEAEDYAVELEAAMIEGMQRVMPSVPVTVDAEINDTWTP